MQPEEKPISAHFVVLVCIFAPYFQVLQEQLHTIASFPPCGAPACLVLVMPYAPFMGYGEWSLLLA